jgi:hypothetical protein
MNFGDEPESYYPRRISELQTELKACRKKLAETERRLAQALARNAAYQGKKMTDSTDDLDHPSIRDTYCKNHPGLWPHECGCLDQKEPKAYKKAKNDERFMIERDEARLRVSALEGVLKLVRQRFSLLADKHSDTACRVIARSSVNDIDKVLVPPKKTYLKRMDEAQKCEHGILMIEDCEDCEDFNV